MEVFCSKGCNDKKKFKTHYSVWAMSQAIAQTGLKLCMVVATNTKVLCLDIKVESFSKSEICHADFKA